MTKITSDALICATVTEVDVDDERIDKVVLRLSDGRYVELYALCDIYEDVWMEVM